MPLCPYTFPLVPALPLQVGEFTEDTIPTVGFNMRKVNKVRRIVFCGSALPLS